MNCKNRKKAGNLTIDKYKNSRRKQKLSKDILSQVGLDDKEIRICLYGKRYKYNKRLGFAHTLMYIGAMIKFNNSVNIKVSILYMI